MRTTPKKTTVDLSKAKIGQRLRMRCGKIATYHSREHNHLYKHCISKGGGLFTVTDEGRIFVGDSNPDPSDIVAILPLPKKAAKPKPAPIHIDGRDFNTPLEASLHLLWLIQRLCQYKPKSRIGEPCDGFRFREGIVEARKLLKQLSYEP